MGGESGHGEESAKSYPSQTLAEPISEGVCMCVCVCVGGRGGRWQVLSQGSLLVS